MQMSMKIVQNFTHSTKQHFKSFWAPHYPLLMFFLMMMMSLAVLEMEVQKDFGLPTMESARATIR